MRLPHTMFCLALLLSAVCTTHAAAQASRVTTGAGGPQVYDFDTPHSAVDFSVKFMGVSKVRGGFAEFDGTLVYDAAHPERSTVSAAIQAASINTNSAMRDRDLRSDNFFDAEKFPVITFHSTHTLRSGSGVVLEGPLTMHGVTRMVRLPVQHLHAATKDAWGNTRIGFTGHMRLSRKDFGILGTRFWNSEFDPGRMSISDSVDIDLMIEAETPNVEGWTAPQADSLIVRAAKQGVQATVDQFRMAAADSPSLMQASEVMLERAGRKLLQRGKADDALAFLALDAELNPKAISVLVWRARAQLAIGDARAALVSARQAMAVEPTNPAANELVRWLEKP